MASYALLFTLTFAFAVGSEICFKPCTREYNPICGVNVYNEVQLFGNLCSLENSVCETKMGKFRIFIYLERFWKDSKVQ